MLSKWFALRQNSEVKYYKYVGILTEAICELQYSSGGSM